MNIKKILSNAVNSLKNIKYIQKGDLLIESDDDFEADVIAECYRTGKQVMRSRPNKEKNNV